MSTTPGARRAGADGHHGHAVQGGDQGGDRAGDDGRDESSAERQDRNWNELLQELRVTQTGVQILTGFLLTLPFQSRFTSLSDGQRTLYLIVLLLSAATTGTLIAPVSAHRLLFRTRRKRRLVSLGHAASQLGLLLLALTVTGVVLLVFDVVTDATTARVAATATLAFFVVVWVVLPLALRRARD